MKKELLVYNKLDCLVLYQVINKFALEIFNLFKLNLINSPTLSSLAFKIFRTHYIKDGLIPISNIEEYNYIKQSYKGGHVDVYRPYHKGKIYCYDYNSLYPSVMANFPMPVGNPRYFTGYINLETIFGFVKVTCPKMYCPVLLTDLNDRSVAPIGKWIGLYFSEELKFAKTLGYQFEVLEGVDFEKEIIFDKFINNLYNYRLNYNKNHPLNLISKLLWIVPMVDSVWICTWNHSL